MTYIHKYILRDLRDYLKICKVKYRIRTDCTFCGASGLANKVFIGLSGYNTKRRDDINRVYSILFHEIGHIINFRRGKYKKYHSGQFNRYSKKYKRFIALRAERYTDKIAQKQMKIVCPTLRYVPGYSHKEDKKFLYNYHNL